jgi:putative transposase
MPRKRHKPEEIVAKLRRIDVLVSQGQSAADAVRGIGVTEVTYYRWHQEFGGLKTDQIKWTKELEAENARLRRATAMYSVQYGRAWRQIASRVRPASSLPACRPSHKIRRVSRSLFSSKRSRLHDRRSRSCRRRFEW